MNQTHTIEQNPLLDRLHHRLIELVDLATLLTAQARRDRLGAIMRQARSIGYTLHAARDLLDQIGEDYAAAASAYVAAGERMLHELNDQLQRHRIEATA